MADLAKILGDAVDALNAAKAKHPRSAPLPDGTGGGGRVTWMTIARNSCDRAHREGLLTHTHVFDEETAEVMAETDPVKLRAELMHVMAACLRWVEELDDEAPHAAHRKAFPGFPGPPCIGVGHGRVYCTCGQIVRQCACGAQMKPGDTIITKTIDGCMKCVPIT